MSPERIRNDPYNYLSDIWSFGLVILECATGKYPFHEQLNCIEMAQTILDTEKIDIPSQFGSKFHDFIYQCVNKVPSARLPAEVLLGSPWLVYYGATSYENSVANVRNWILSLNNSSNNSNQSPGSMDVDNECKHK